MPEPIYGESSSTPSYTSSYSGSNNSGSSNNWSGNDWAGEFASAPSNVSYPPPDEDPYDWRTDSDYGGSTYVPTFGNTDEDFASAYGGLSYDWSNNNDFFTDTSGNQIGQPGLGLWNPFIAGFHPETGEPIPLTTSQFNEMMDLGEFPWPLGGSTTTGGGNSLLSTKLSKEVIASSLLLYSLFCPTSRSTKKERKLIACSAFRLCPLKLLSATKIFLR